MKKRWMSLILTVIMMLSLAGCGRNADLSSVSRDPADSDGTVWFDEEAVALAGSVQRAKQRLPGPMNFAPWQPMHWHW